MYIYAINENIGTLIKISDIDAQDLSPLILLANCMSFGMMVTLLAWMAHKLVSSKRPTKYDSDAS